MAGDWIKFEVATSDKPEVWAIAGQLGIDPDAVVGKLLRVWAWFDQHTTDGNAPSVTSALLDRCVGVTGFCKAVTLAGWMVDDGSTISLPNFDMHNGETAKKRCQTAKRVAKHKKGNAPYNAKVTQPALPNALPREDTREDTREDIKTTINQSSDAGENMPPVDNSAQIVQLVPDLAKPFPMYSDWVPDDEFSSQLKASGHSGLWLNHLDEFVLFWRSKPAETQNQWGWQNKFLKNVISEEIRREANLA